MIKYIILMLINVKCSNLTNSQIASAEDSITPMNISLDSQFDPLQYLNENSCEINDLYEICNEYIYSDASDILNYSDEKAGENSKINLLNLQHQNITFCNIIAQSTIQTNTNEINTQESSFKKERQNLKEKKIEICTYNQQNNYSKLENNAKIIKISNESVEESDYAIIYNSNPMNVAISEKCNERVHTSNKGAYNLIPIVELNSVSLNEKKNDINVACKNPILISSLGKRKSFEENTSQNSTSLQNSPISKSKVKRVYIKLKPKIQNESENVKKLNLIFENMENNFYVFFKESKNFISMIEKKINFFLNNKIENTNLNIKKVLYNSEFIVIDNFEVGIFGCYNIENINIFKQISTTFDCLNSFIKELEITQYEIDCLIKDTNLNLENITIEVLTREIETLIINFLQSEDAEHIICFLPQLKSYVSLNTKIEIDYNKNVIKGFIVFLFLIKRNYICIDNFNGKITECKRFTKINSLLRYETLHNLVFLMVFLNHWLIKMKHNIIFNMATIIKINCVLYSDLITIGKSSYINIILISEHLFFELMNYKLFENIDEILNSHIFEKSFFRQNKELKEFCEHLRNEISKIFLKYCNDLIKKINSKVSSIRYKNKILAVLGRPDGMSLYQLKDALNFFNKFKVYERARKRWFLYKILLNFIRKKVLCSENDDSDK